jgi:membrane-associated protease RseP (regulator of RpoE activity)
MNIRGRCITCSVILTGLSLAETIPQRLLEGLASEQFKVRESSQAEIEKWVDENGQVGVAAIYRVHRDSEDPEVRLRCLRVLRSRSDKDYMNEGQGYLGVQLADEILDLPGNDEPKTGIRVNYVMPGSQAELAGIKAGDVIVSMDGKKVGPTDEFIKIVASYKPLRKVIFTIKRLGEEPVIEVTVILGKRPVQDLRMMYGADLGQLEKDARDKHFEEWLKKQKTAE